MKLSGTRYRLMAALMISSQLLLTAFVLYWLAGQYREERTLLHGQLKKEYILAQDQQLDSMLMKHLVMPSLDDSVMVKILAQDKFAPDNMMESSATVVSMKKIFKDTLPDEEMLSIHLDGSVLPDSGMRTFDVSTSFSEEERMVRSVRLFINENPMAFHSNAGVHVFAMNLDTSSLLLNLERAMEEKGWPFVLEWTGDGQSNAELAKVPGILLSGGADRDLPALHVQHYGAYLIRSILPQILFGLILLILSASALLFAYRSLQRQLALSKLRDDFIGNISHELKTPVSTVKIALEALRNYDLQKDPAKSEEYLEMAASELERLERLVNKVLHHEMLNNPSLLLEKEDCNLGDLVRSVLRTLETPIREAGAIITVEEKGEACKVKVDRIYVEGLIMNLIDNSLKYTGGNPKILIKVECKTSGTSLSVSDDGPGIPKQYKDQVFEKFFRIPAGNKHKVKGYGLGLNFAAQVIAQHGGSISFSNLSEGGCRFTLQFPPIQA